MKAKLMMLALTILIMVSSAAVMAKGTAMHLMKPVSASVEARLYGIGDEMGQSTPAAFTIALSEQVYGIPAEMGQSQLVPWINDYQPGRFDLLFPKE